MVTQLRRYRIEAGKLDRFVEEWRTGVVPLRERFGFTIHGAWAVPDTSEFVWILGHDDFVDADRSYYASEDRKQLSPDPALHIEETFHGAAYRVM